MSGSDAEVPSPEQIVEMLPGIAQALEEVTRNRGASPMEFQANIWNTALHSS